MTISSRLWCAACGFFLVMLLLAGCAAKPGVRVVLLPQEDGAPSSLIVTSNTGEKVVSAPYQSAAAAQGKATVLQQTNAVDINRQYNPLFAVAPAKPKLYTVYFNLGSTDLVASSRVTLFDATQDALKRSGADVVIMGHTDTTGTETGNDRLSLHRAELVQRLLVQRGFDRSRIEVNARGERDPAVPTANLVSEPRNRRVDILVR